MKDKIDVDGHDNFTVNGDLIIGKEDKDVSLGDVFSNLDSLVKKNIVSDGRISRANASMPYSSEALFTSLVKIGMPVNAAFLIPRDIIPVLEEMIAEKDKAVLESSDIRYAVAECIGGLTFEGHTEEEASMWCAAYVKRYGNPDNDFIYVVDHAEDKILNFEFLAEEIIPHLLRRILGLGRYQNAIKQFPEIFSTAIVEKMSREILSTVNSLDLYSIRYKTLINLLQDIVIEPPHPWLVNVETASTVFKYNQDRMDFHYKQLLTVGHKNPGTLMQHAKEYFMHSCAVILSMYGAFLGIGAKYGLVELQRVLKIRHKNPTLWNYCEIGNIEQDLKEIEIDISSFGKILKRTSNKLNSPPNDNLVFEMRVQAKDLVGIVERLTTNKAQQPEKLSASLHIFR